MTPAQREAVARKLNLGIPAEWSWAQFAEEFPNSAQHFLGVADEVIAAYEAAAWQPIESAPHDNGARYLIGSADGVWEVQIAASKTRRWLDLDGETRKLGPVETTWYYDTDLPDAAYAATRWRRLPPEPATAKEDDRGS
jgi:hypothetical protein